MLNLNDIKRCAAYFQNEFIDKVYEIETECGVIITIKSEGKQFPHLVGLKRSDYLRYGYHSAQNLFNDILNPSFTSFNARLIPPNIRESSLKGKKIKNFEQMHILLTNINDLCINYNSSASSSRLDHVDYLFSNYLSGFSLGCIFEPSNNSFVLSTWIDESSSSQSQKEKYYPSQTTDLIKRVSVYNLHGTLLEEKVAKRKFKDYLRILSIVQRNNMTLRLPSNGNLLIKLICKLPFCKCNIIH